jgi:probable F420-dependent oxidoreductase
MKVDFTLEGKAGDWDVAAEAERRGYDGGWLSEIKHDPFPALAVAATRTERMELGTAIALAFARNPMSLAVLANDLQLYSGGRFVLGVGSQIKPHITKRFSMPWSSPAGRMREYLLAVRAIWHSWATDEPLRFLGEHYTHTLMTPFFNPGPNPHGNPPVILAAVGELMTAAAGRVADGLLAHSFTTESYLRERTLPALRAARGGTLDGFTICLPALVVLGATAEERATAEQAVRGQIAFYGSTPSYRAVLEQHGWGDLGDQLNAMSRRQAWAEMGAAITDDVLDAFAVTGTAPEVAVQLRTRFGGIVDRISLYTPYTADSAQLAEVRTALQS